MKSKSDKTGLNKWQEIALFPVVQGTLLGAFTIFSITPLLNWTNCKMNNQKMNWNKPLAGWRAYTSSAAPSYAAVFALKLLFPSTPDDSFVYNFSTSFTAGALAGLAGVPSEVIAQNQHLAKLETGSETVKKMKSSNGYGSFFKGGGATMLREGMWSTTYLTSVPGLAHYLQQKGMEKNTAQATAVVTTSVPYAVLSTPFHLFRSKKQFGLTAPINTPSYVQIGKKIWNEDLSASTFQRLSFLFRGARERTVTVLIATILMVKGEEHYTKMIRSMK
ncbi:MAG TPA: MC/SLC25 family protein [Legionella sp.]|nr:MC/SLC25 family protein [Legionella sp.]